MEINGSQIIVECLVEQGVDTVFGYPGGSVLNIYDALYKNSDRIHHILTSHEQGASHAADGYARATGRVGVCIATSGPGATNLVTGIATAHMDSVPMVVITGNVTTPLLGKDSFQEVDITGITIPITKHNYIVKDVKQLAEIIREAFYIARSGRPGPVLIDIAKDVTAAKCEYKSEKIHKQEKSIGKMKESDIENAVNIINNAKRPILYVGGGVIISESQNEVKKFAELINAPVTTSLMGKGGFPDSHRLATGMVGMHGTVASNYAMSNSDCIIALGARFSDRVTSRIESFAKHAKIVHFDIDTAEINKNVLTDAHVVGDLKPVLDEVLPRLNERKADEWNKQVDEWKKVFKDDHFINKDLNPKVIMHVVDNLVKNAIISTEVGQHQMWAAQYYNFEKGRTFISSGGLGTMGYGLGASIGAQVGRPDMQVIHIAGDGSFRMNCNELATVEAYQIPIITVLMNNSKLGMVRQWQAAFYGERYSQTDLDKRGPDFNKLADAYSIMNFLVKTKEEFEKALSDALAAKKPALINCLIDVDERVLPMVAPGKDIDDIILN